MVRLLLASGKGWTAAVVLFIAASAIVPNLCSSSSVGLHGRPGSRSDSRRFFVLALRACAADRTGSRRWRVRSRRTARS